MERTDYSRMGNPEVRALHAEIDQLRFEKSKLQSELGLVYRSLSLAEDQGCVLECDLAIIEEIALWRLDAIRILASFLNDTILWKENWWDVKYCAMCDEPVYLAKKTGEFITIGMHSKLCESNGVDDNTI